MQNATPNNDLMSPQEAASYLRITVLALAKMRWTGRSELPFLKLNRKTVRYRRSDLDEWLAQRVVNSALSRTAGSRSPAPTRPGR